MRLILKGQRTIIDPQDRAFSSRYSTPLETRAGQDNRHLKEEALEEFDITGIADLYIKKQNFS